MPERAVRCAEAPRGQKGPAAQLRWAVEHDDRSVAELKQGDESSGAALTLHYKLGPGRPFNQFAALVGAVRDGLSRYDRVTFTARASHPLRVGVQLRPVGRDNPPRWQRSIYLDESSRTVTVRFDDLRPIPRDVTGPPPLASIGALMFVVDTNNTVPGTSGDIVFTDIAFGFAGSQRECRSHEGFTLMTSCPWAAWRSEPTPSPTSVVSPLRAPPRSRPGGRAS